MNKRLIDNFSLGKDFYIIQFSEFLYSVGLRSIQFALAWWILTITNDPTVFSFFVTVALISDVISRCFLGWLGDVYNKKLLIEICYFVSLIFSIFIAVLTAMQLYIFGVLFLCQCIIGFSIGIREPIQSSIIVSLVDRSQIAEAVRWRAMVLTMASFVAPLFGTVLISYVEPIGTMYIGIAITLIALIALRFVSLGTTENEANKDKLTNGSWYSGIKVVYKLPPEKFLAKVSFLINLGLCSIFGFILPVYFQKNFSESPWLLGVVEISFAIGLFIGASKVNLFLNSFYGRARSTFFSYIVSGVGILFISLISKNLPEYSYWYFVPVCMIFMFVGIGIATATINSNFLRTVATPKSYLNRVNAAALFCSGLAAPVGIALTGYAYSFLDPFVVFLLLSLLLVITSIFTCMSHELKEALSLSDERMDGFYSNRYPKVFIEEEK